MEVAELQCEQSTLNPAIFKSNNINLTDWYKFLSSRRKKASFGRSGLTIYEYIKSLIDSNEVSIEEIDEFSYKKLFYGQNRRVFISNLNNIKLDLKDIKELLDCEFNITLNNNLYNKISLTNVYDNDVDKISLIEIDANENNSEIKNIKIIITRKVSVMRCMIDEMGNKYTTPVTTNAYFPIELDFENNIIIGKTSTSDYIDENSDLIIKNYMMKFVNLIEAEIHSKSSIYKQALCKMSNILLDSIIKEKSKPFLKSINKEIDDFVNLLETKLEDQNININQLKQSLVYKDKSTFDIKYMITNYIENVVLSDNLLKSTISREGLEGIVSYIKFSDRKQINVTITTRKKTQSLIDSDTYLSLRTSLKDSKMIERLKVVFYNGQEDISLYYDASNMNFLEIHFYSTLYEEDFKYGLNKIRRLSNEQEI